MAVIKLKETDFHLIPEGTYVWTIKNAKYDAKFNKVKVEFENENGEKITNPYGLSSDGGAKAFSYLAKTAINDYSVKEIDPETLVGKKVIGDIEHAEMPSTVREGEMVKFANLRNIKVYEGDEVKPKATTTADLMSFLS